MYLASITVLRNQKGFEYLSIRADLISEMLFSYLNYTGCIVDIEDGNCESRRS